MYQIGNIETAVTHLKQHQMYAECLETSKHLLERLPELVPEGATVAFGGSMTLYETGVIAKLRDMAKEGKITLLDRDQDGLTRPEVEEIFRKAFFCDVYFCSVNAVTEDGWIYQVDGNGNRVAAMTFGPKSVVAIAGKNKLVKTKADAVARVEEVAAPKNAQRLHMNTPCAKTGKCMHCNSQDRICCSYAFFGRQRIKDRIKVIFLNEDWGY